MGYKGVIRSARGSVNRSIRASEVKTNKRRRELEQQQRQIQAMHEKFKRKVALAEERRLKPVQKLNDQYAAGKIDKKTFEDLSKRDSDVTIDLMIFGGNTGITLAQRYVTGNIDTQEFEQLKNEIIGEPEKEKDKIIEEFERQVNSANDFATNARKNKTDDKCNSCGRIKKFYSPLLKQSDFKLCLPCVAKYKKICNYSGHNGVYYTAAPLKLKSNEKNDITLNIVADYILNYR